MNRGRDMAAGLVICNLCLEVIYNNCATLCIYMLDPVKDSREPWLRYGCWSGHL